MKIGIFSDTYFPQINGVVTSILMLQKELENLGHDVYIITVSLPNEKNKMDTQHEKIIRVKSIPFMFLKNHRVACYFPFSLYQRIKSLNLDLIHSHTEFSIGLFAKLLAKKLDIPLIHTYHTMYEEYVHYIAKGKIIRKGGARKYSKMFCNFADAVIAPTQKTKNFLLRCHVKKPISIIPTGIDLRAFQQEYSIHDLENFKENLGFLRQDKILLLVGRLAKEKSLDVVFRALPELINKQSNLKILVVGDGPMKGALEKLAKELKIDDHILFTGEVPWENIAKFYAISTVFCSASLTETQGLTFIEAMACGLMVVARKDDSIKELIQDNKNGRIFSQETQLSQILWEALQDTAENQTIRSAAIHTANTFSSQIFGKRVLKLYENYLCEKNSSSLRCK